PRLAGAARRLARVDGMAKVRRRSHHRAMLESRSSPEMASGTNRSARASHDMAGRGPGAARHPRHSERAGAKRRRVEKRADFRLLMLSRVPSGVAVARDGWR